PLALHGDAAFLRRKRELGLGQNPIFLRASKGMREPAKYHTKIRRPIQAALTNQPIANDSYPKRDTSLRSGISRPQDAVSYVPSVMIEGGGCCKAPFPVRHLLYLARDSAELV